MNIKEFLETTLPPPSTKIDSMSNDEYKHNLDKLNEQINNINRMYQESLLDAHTIYVRECK